MLEYYSLELKSLILGLTFSLGIFAVKSGAGFSYLLQAEARRWRRLLLVCGFISSYTLVFSLAWWLVCRVDFFAHIDKVMLFFKNGMTLHFLLAALLLLWGVALLKKEPDTGKSRAWLVLALPCPVCFSVILFSGAFLHNLMPRVNHIFVWLFAGFITLSLFSAILILFIGSPRPEHKLGTIMVLAALYFFITIAMVPQFADIERIYRLSLGSVTTLPQLQPLPGLDAGVLLAFGLGFIRKLRRSSWK